MPPRRRPRDGCLQVRWAALLWLIVVCALDAEGDAVLALGNLLAAVGAGGHWDERVGVLCSVMSGHPKAGV